MSLLLDALKKAEKAKQDAKRGTKGAADGAADPAPDAFSLAPAEEPRHVVTRDELPDITRPVEIQTEDLAAPVDMARESSAARPAQRARVPSEPAAEPKSSEQAAARKVFEAKFSEPNPRMPFYVVMTLLVIAALGTGAYFWFQLRPPPPLVNPNPPRGNYQVPTVPTGTDAAPAKADEVPAAIPGLPQASGSAAATTAAAAPSAPAKAPAAAQPNAPAASPSVPPSTTPGPSAPPAASGAAKPVPRARSRAAAPERTQAAESAAPANAPRPAPSLHPGVETGYAAYLKGDLAAARDGYLAALKDDPNNRDGLLGMAAIESAAQRFELAETYYQRLLQVDPRDPYAQAGIISLRGNLVDPVAAESRMKSLLTAEPDAAVLNFSLGNQLAQQARWPEAQQAYFRAYTVDPDNPDIAYNLAISLDHLRQSALAIRYYRRALANAEKRPGAFSQLAVRNRIADLAR